MEAKAVARKIRISADKARLVIDLIRGKEIEEARAILNNQTQKASNIILKVLNSAVSNAENNLELDPNNLYIKECYVDEGKTLKRIRPGSRGHVDRHDHRYCHITVIVALKQ